MTDRAKAKSAKGSSEAQSRRRAFRLSKPLSVALVSAVALLVVANGFSTVSGLCVLQADLNPVGLFQALGSRVRSAYEHGSSWVNDLRLLYAIHFRTAWVPIQDKDSEMEPSPASQSPPDAPGAECQVSHSPAAGRAQSGA